MKVNYLATEEVGQEIARLLTTECQLYWATAWATKNSLIAQLVENKAKITIYIIGTDFYQTDPDVLKKLSNLKSVHIFEPNKGATFHPKIYGFVSTKSAVFIIGSNNFTNGGLHKNHEAALIIEGTPKEDAIQAIIKSIEDWWKTSIPINNDFLKGYEKKYKIMKKHRGELSQPIQTPKPKPDARYPSLLDASWEEYKELLHQKSKNLQNRITLLQGSRQIFSGQEDFSQLSELERKAIAGIIGSREIEGSALEGIDWGWLGSMSGAGSFKSIIISNHPDISKALDCIPFQGEVTEKNYNNYIKYFSQSFENEERSGRLPTASRLLALKRPDYFICINKHNASEIAKNFGTSRTHIDIESYWEKIIKPIQQTEWWQEQRPTGEAGKIWDGRVALLDALFYVP